MADVADAVVEHLRAAGVGRGGLVALALAPEVGLGLAWPGGRLVVPAGPGDLVDIVRNVEDGLRPRWVMWSQETALILVRAGLRLVACWDLAAVHRLLVGRWTADAAVVWAAAHDLGLQPVPSGRQADLFNQTDPTEGPVRDDGYLSTEWLGGGWAESPDRVEIWADLALQVAERQQAKLDGRRVTAVTVRAESAAELLCAELAVDGLPVDRAIAEELIAGYVGPRTTTEAEAARQRARRDDEVLRHAPADSPRFDLRSPGQVKSLLRRVGIEVVDTRAWRLEELRAAHPLVDALLAWRKAERIATTYGYAWLDEHVGADGRLRGEWSGADGAAGRMTATAGLHNLPGDLRQAVVAEPGHVLARADLGQIEPRVLAAVSGDRALARATQAADMYAPVAADLGVDRATAKVAMLGAMYGQTTGHGAQVLRRLTNAYPVAMRYLQDGDASGQAGRDVRTYGGRVVRMGPVAPARNDREARRHAAARGRYGRNALVQGAAAELFKVWSATVRARGPALDARIVLCLHDELLVHVPAENGPSTVQLLLDCLHEAVDRWAPDDSVRFIADIAVIDRWSDAK